MSENINFDSMFNELYENRKEDLLRAIEARQRYEKRPQRAEKTLAYYKDLAGRNIKPLSEKELEILKETWKDIWDLGVVKPEWYAIYKAKTGVFDPTVIGTDLHYYYTEWNKIDFDYLRGFLDKNYGDIILPCIRHPKTYIRKIHGTYRDTDFEKLTIDEAIDKLYAIRSEGAVVKVSRTSCGGKGVTFISEDDTKDTIREKLTVDRDVVVQSVIKQHKDMEAMNPSSVNSIRIISIMLSGESIPLSTVVRIGKKGSRVDNFSSGGYACGVNPDGTLKEFAYDSSGNRHNRHHNGFKFKNGRIPNYEKVLQTVKDCHNHVPMFGVVSWDIAITEDGDPIMIEYNVGQGGITSHQYCNGPVYGEYRERIINEVFANYQVRNGNLDYNYSMKNGECTITVGSKKVSELCIPEKLDDVPVTKIADSAFKENENLETLQINARLKKIGFTAFFECKSLVSVSFADAVEEFGRSCFNSCTSLESICLPEGTKIIRTRAFAYCRNLKSIYIPDSVETIEPEAFLGTPNVTILCKENSVAYNYAKDNKISRSIKA